MSRLFVAAPLPRPVRTDLAERLPRAAEPGVRWVPEEQWHVTLRFLGEADEDAAAGALDDLRAPPATVTLGPRVSRLGRDVVCLPADGLDELARAVRAATAHVGEPPGRPFVGHVTLARLRNRGACGITGTPILLRYPVDEIVLVRSTLGPTGATHEPLLTVPLAGG
ncbi:MAG TPA: RNA 2',3'-cyclic phosphodiesterase [Acidimicrobiales bacterium]